MDNDKKIDDIINMLDGFVKNNIEHMNIEVQNGAVVKDKNVKIINSLDCAKGNLACQVPTLLDCIEDN